MIASNNAQAGEKIIVADMRNPQLSPMQADALAWAEANPVSITRDSVLNAAIEETGMTDFGPEDFLERLDIWIETINDEKTLVPLARRSVFEEMVRYAANRLRIEDAVRRHPEILEIEIDRPLIVAGLPRSGTTHLQNFLSADDRLRSLPWWEAVRPVPASPEENGDPATDPRWASAAAAWERTDAMMPYIKIAHPFDPDHISEDTELQCIDFGSYHLEWSVPNRIWADYYQQYDHSSTYRYLKKVLQVLTFYRGPNRWLMKCPQHMEQLSALHSVFPDATFIITHRDPVASIQSAITSLGYSARVRVKKVDPEAIAAYWMNRYGILLDRCVQDRDELPEDRVEDVYFSELMADPMAVVERIYAKADLPLTDEVRAKMEAFLEGNERGKHGAFDYDLRRDFGLEPAEVRKRFGAYLQRFPVKIEVK